MFGDIFDTADDLMNPQKSNILSYSERKPRNCAFFLELPTLKREEKHFAGLRNQGATCYLNSLFQALYLSPEFRDAIFSLPLLKEDENEKCAYFNSESKFKILFALQKLFSEMQSLDSRSISTEEITKSFGWENNQQMQQQDIQEAMRIFFDVLERAMFGTPFAESISRNYRGIFVNHISCIKCGKVKEREEFFYDLMIQVRGFNNLQESLKSFITPEKLDGNNQYFCENCNTKVDALKGIKLRHVPPILTFSLNRFCFDFEILDRIKVNDNFGFPLELSIKNYLEVFENIIDLNDKNQNSSNEEYIYELFEIIVHRGDAYHGHYFIYARDVLDVGDWNEQMEKYLIQNTNKVIAEPNGHSKNKEENKLEEEDQNKELKKDVKSNETGKKKNKNNKDSSAKKGKNKKNEKNDKPNEKLIDIKDEAFDDVGFPFPFSNADLSKKWYCLNDSTVTAVPVNRLQKQFGGSSENAYVLIYRKKNLDQNKRIPEIPFYLKKTLELQNMLFEQERENYRREEKMLEVFIVDPTDIDFEKKEFVDEKANYFNIKLCFDDEVKTILEKVAFQKMTSERNFSLIEVEQLENKLLHYKRIIDFSNEKTTLNKLEISHLSYFLYTFHDETYKNSILEDLGMEKIPIKLNIFHEKSSTLIPALSSYKLNDFQSKLEKRFKITRSQQILRIIKENVSILLNVNEQNDEKTLKDLGIENGADIYLSTAEEDVIIIQNFFIYTSKNKNNEKNEEGFEDENLKTIFVDSDDNAVCQYVVNLNWTLSELLNYIKERMSLNNPTEYRIKNLKRGTLFYQEELGKSLKELELGEGAIRLRVERGSFPQSGNISLTIISQTKHHANKNERINIICTPNSTLTELLDIICKPLNLNPTQHKLYQVDWLEEPINSLTKMDKTLSINSIKNLDVLILRDLENTIPKESLKFLIYLTLTGSPIDSQYLDVIQIRDEENLDQLKLKILSMPMMQSFSHLHPDNLRVREMKKDQFFGRILRNSDKPLKKLGINSDNLVCQPLKEPEEILENDLCLLFRMRDVSKKTYRDYIEKTFYASKEPSIDELKRFVIASFGFECETNQIELAKYITHEFSWLHLHSTYFEEIRKKKKNANRKKKKNSRKSKMKNAFLVFNKNFKAKMAVEKEKNIYNLRKMPYMMKDGDIIGIRLEIENLDKSDDFQTMEDLETKLRIQQQKSSSKKQQRTERRVGDSAAFQIFTDF